MTNLAKDAVAAMRSFSEEVVLVGSGTPITSRSYRAKDKSMLSVSLPMREVVVKDWVTDANDASCASHGSTGVAQWSFKKIG